MGYKNTADVVATQADDEAKVNLTMKDLHLFSYGAFSNVYKGRVQTSQCEMDVVIKKTWCGLKEPRPSMEIVILKMLNRMRHKNIVRLHYTFSTDYSDKICMSLVFEFMPQTLYEYLKQHNRRIHITETKMFAWQLFRGQDHLLRANICHRDIKPQNLLVDPETGLLKISDFGSSVIDPDQSPQPSYHVTRYYRPPELLLGSKTYTGQVDIWSAGCVMAEMLRGHIAFLGRDSAHQLELIFDCFGIPTHDEILNMKVSKAKWRDAKAAYAKRNLLPYSLIRLFPGSPSACTPEAVALLSRVLTYDPPRRAHGRSLLLDPFFDELFRPATRRPCGRPISCLTMQDRNEVESGDQSMTGSATISGQN